MLSSATVARLSRTRNILTDVRNRLEEWANNGPPCEIECDLPGCEAEAYIAAPDLTVCPSWARPHEQVAALNDAIELIDLVLNTSQAGA